MVKERSNIIIKDEFVNNLPAFFNKIQRFFNKNHLYGKQTLKAG